MICFWLLFSSHALVAVSHLPQSTLVKSCYFCCTWKILELFSKYKSGSFNSGSVHHRRGVYGQASQPHSSLTSLSSQESHLSINEQNPILIGKSTWQTGGQCFVPSNQFDLPVPFIWINSRQTSPNSSGQIKCHFSSMFWAEPWPEALFLARPKRTSVIWTAEARLVCVWWPPKTASAGY